MLDKQILEGISLLIAKFEADKKALHSRRVDPGAWLMIPPIALAVKPLGIVV